MEIDKCDLFRQNAPAWQRELQSGALSVFSEQPEGLCSYKARRKRASTQDEIRNVNSR